MTCSCKGFGLDVATPGGTLSADPCSPLTDASVRLPMLQQMLADLGFYKGPITATLTPDVALQVSAASSAYAQSKGFTAVTPTAVVCASLVADWQAKKASQRNLLIGGGVVLAIGAYLLLRRKR